MLTTPPPPSVVDPLAGVVCFLSEARVRKGEPDVFVMYANCADVTAYGFPSHVASRGTGAGLTHSIAYEATIGEAVERYACSIVHPEELLFGTYEELCAMGENPTPPDHWSLIDPAQEQARLSVFRNDTPIVWTHAESLTARRDCLVPACLVYMPYSRPFRERGERVVGYPISTGAACAPSRADALLRGLCEVIERDAFTIVWRNRLRCPRVRIDEASALYSEYHDHFARPGLEYTLYYTTLDLAIPSFFGVLIDQRHGRPALIAGGAAHPDPIQAARKTLVELAHGLRWMDYFGDEDFPPEPGFRNIHTFEDRARLYAYNDMRDALNFLADTNEIALSSIANLQTGVLATDLHRTVRTMAEQGLDVIAKDLTSVDIEQCGYYVLRVMVPQCEPLEGDHSLPFLGGRRWREVPQRLGLHADPLNPYPHPYP